MNRLSLLLCFSLITVNVVTASDNVDSVTAPNEQDTSVEKGKFALPDGVAIQVIYGTNPFSSYFVNSMMCTIAIARIKKYFDDACKLGEQTDLSENVAISNSFLVVATMERVISSLIYKIYLDPSWTAWQVMLQKAISAITNPGTSNVQGYGDFPTTYSIDTLTCRGLASVACCSFMNHRNDLKHLSSLTPAELPLKSHFGSLFNLLSQKSTGNLPSLINDLSKEHLANTDKLHEVALELVTVIRDLFTTIYNDPKCSQTVKNAIAQVSYGKDGLFKRAVDTYSTAILKQLDLPLRIPVPADTKSH